MKISAKGYKVAIKNEPFVLGEEELSDKTVKVTFTSEGILVATHYYAYTTKEALYEKIKNEEDLNLDNFYVKEFSLEEYRKVNELPDRTFVKLNGFSAKNVFFESEKGTDFSFAHFNSGTKSFAESVFTYGTTSFHKADFDEGQIVFDGVNFGMGDVNFQFAIIEKGSVSFKKATFYGNLITFVNCNFGNGNVDFKEANFGNKNSKVNFHFAKFGKGNKTFEKCIFDVELIDFRRNEFGDGRVNFRRVDFGNSEVLFDESEFISGKISFRSSTFGSGQVSFHMTNFGADEVSFENVYFGEGNVSFAESISTTLILKSTQFNSYVDMRVNSCQKMDISNSLVRDIMDFKPIEYPVKIEQLNVKGMRNLGRLIIDWRKNKVFELISNQEDTHLSEKAEQFRMMKEEFNASGEYDDEDKAYVEFKRYELEGKLDKLTEKNHPKLWQFKINYFFQKLIFDKMGLYATDPLRVLRSMFVVFSIYSLIYTIVPYFSDASVANCAPEGANFIEVLGNNLYFSAITFLTVGYGDCLPTGIFKILAPLEGWMGVFLMSYFTVAFVRKILR